VVEGVVVFGVVVLGVVVFGVLVFAGAVGVLLEPQPATIAPLAIATSTSE
jgi:hypothetical protein